MKKNTPKYIIRNSTNTEQLLVLHGISQIVIVSKKKTHIM